ncbi:MAG: hypothetical protein J5486_04400 [Bacteroidaceae bacterium]|nr:hypothetical protein [Bacteroidaceae bacterium]
MSTLFELRHAATAAISAAVGLCLLICCVPAQQTEPASPAPADSLSTDSTGPAPMITDTIRGRVTDAATRAIELSVVMDFELTDDVDRQTAVEVGKDVEIVLRHEPDGSQTVIAVREPQ